MLLMYQITQHSKRRKEKKMALINCPECGKELSDKALTCPHCGYPVKQQKETRYSLSVGRPSANGFATFLQVCAVICWIGGLIIAIAGANITTITSYYNSKTEFSFGTFLTLLVPYVIYGVLFLCMSTVVSQISATYDIVSGLRLEATEIGDPNGYNAHNVSNSKPTYISHPKNRSGEWKCPKCGTHNSANALYCKDCGEYR